MVESSTCYERSMNWLDDGKWARQSFLEVILKPRVFKDLID